MQLLVNILSLHPITQLQGSTYLHLQLLESLSGEFWGHACQYQVLRHESAPTEHACVCRRKLGGGAQRTG